MKPTYYVCAAPHHPAPHYAFRAFSVHPGPVELFDIAHVIVVAEVVAEMASASTPFPIPPHQTGAQPSSSHQAVALFYQIMQQETAWPVVRRLVEAFRQINTVLHRENQRARMVVGLVIQETLYLACVGNVSAYLIRGNKVASLLHADRTRDRYLGYSSHLVLDSQLQLLPSAFVLSHPDPAHLPTEHFVLAPNDTLILCSTELSADQIHPAMRYARQPERLSAALAKATSHQQGGRASGVVALHWRVDKVAIAAKHVGLIVLIFLSVTLAMQLMLQFNQHMAHWLAVYAETRPALTHQPLIAESTSSAPTQTSQARTLVQVKVHVNLDETSFLGAGTPAAPVLPVNTSLSTLSPEVSTVVLVAPPDEASNAARMTFVWQSAVALPPIKPMK